MSSYNHPIQVPPEMEKMAKEMLGEDRVEVVHPAPTRRGPPGKSPKEILQADKRRARNKQARKSRRRNRRKS